MKTIKLKLANREYRDDPWEMFGRLRQQGPIIKVKLPFMGKTWAVTTYELVNDVLKDSDHFVRDPKNAGRKNFVPMQWILPRSFFLLIHNMLGADGQKHRRLRFMVDKAFAMRNIEAMSEQIESIAREQLTHASKILQRDGSVDLMEHYARPIPLTVICELLGLPLGDRSKFIKWFAPFSTVKSIFGIFKIGSGIKSCIKYLLQQFKEFESNPRPGLITELVQIEHEGDRLTEEELLSMVFLLLVAGHETTVHLISNTLLCLLQHPNAMQELQSDWSLSGAVIEEVLRYASPIQLAKPRYIAQDLEYHGVRLIRGEMITPLLACANYDPEKYERPDEFDIHRSNNYHMTFGSGPHACLGMKLARSETHHAIKTLLTEHSNLKPAFNINQPDWNPRIGMRGMNSFVVSER